MKKPSPEQLAEIEETAELQFSIKETAIIIGIGERDIEKNNARLTAYMKGRLRAQYEVRKSVLEMSKQGNTMAQKEFQKFADATRIEVE